MLTDRNIRLLLFTREKFPTYRVDVDVLFGKELIGRGHQIDFVMKTESNHKTGGPISWRGRTVWLGRQMRGRDPWSRLVNHAYSFQHDVMCLLRLARPSCYDAVQVRNKFLLGVLACFIAKRRGLHFFYWLSFPVAESQIQQAKEGTARFPIINRIRGYVFGYLLYKLILPCCDHAFVQSPRMMEDFVANGIDRTKLTVVPMGVDLKEFESDDAPPQKLRYVGRRLVLGYLGTLGAQRRLEVLVDMMSLLCAKGVDASLLIVGDSDRREDRKALEERARTLGVMDRIEITGFLPRPEALRRIQHVDIALSPIYPTPVLDAGSPTKLVEYMALGLPVIANRHPEQKEILRESRAGVCVPWGAKHFARGVAWLSKRQLVELRQMGQRGRTWVEVNRDYGEIAKEVENVYLRVMTDETA